MRVIVLTVLFAAVQISYGFDLGGLAAKLPGFKWSTDPCKEFIMKSKTDGLYGLGTYTFVTDECTSQKGCEDDILGTGLLTKTVDKGGCKTKLVNLRVTYHNNKTGQHLYWINTRTDKDAGTWVVGLKSGLEESTSMYNEDCNPPDVTVGQWTHGQASKECREGWKYFNGLEWINDTTITIICTKEIVGEGLLGAITGAIGDTLEGVTGDWLDSAKDFLESAIPVLDVLNLKSGNNPECPGCALEQSSKLQVKFSKCLQAAALSNARKAVKVATLMDAQKNTCELISDMILCHDKEKVPLNICYSEKEVINMKDLLMERQIGEFAKNDLEIRVEECKEVKEYLESGRADNVNKTVKVLCSSKEVNDENNFDCS